MSKTTKWTGDEQRKGAGGNARWGRGRVILGVGWSIPQQMSFIFFIHISSLNTLTECNI